MKSKIYRCNCRDLWSIQNRKTKTTARTVLLKGKWTTELKPERKSDPKGFVSTNRSHDLIINPPSEYVAEFKKVTQLIYDKTNVNFNVKHGDYLYFAEDGGCFILQRVE